MSPIPMNSLNLDAGYLQAYTTLNTSLLKRHDAQIRNLEKYFEEGLAHRGYVISDAAPPPHGRFEQFILDGNEGLKVFAEDNSEQKLMSYGAYAILDRFDTSKLDDVSLEEEFASVSLSDTSVEIIKSLGSNDKDRITRAAHWAMTKLEPGEALLLLKELQSVSELSEKRIDKAVGPIRQLRSMLPTKLLAGDPFTKDDIEATVNFLLQHRDVFKALDIDIPESIGHSMRTVPNLLTQLFGFHFIDLGRTGKARNSTKKLDMTVFEINEKLASWHLYKWKSRWTKETEALKL